jgi:raffinose/stachyose/melibiose transport system permease protein
MRKALRQFFPLLILTLIAACVLYPFVFVILTSLKTTNEVRINPLGMPENWLWQNYPEAWVRGNFGIYFKNSVFIVIPVVLAVIICSTLAGYAFGRFKFRGSRVLFLYFIAGMGVPLEAVIIPLYYTMRGLNLHNTHWSVILPLISLILPFGILLLSSFISQIPSDLLDAAKVDGATNWQTLWYVVVPLSRPAIVTVLVFSSLWTWNQFFLPTVMLMKNNVRTLPVGLAYFVGSYSTEQHLLAAGALMTALPVILLYILFQRQFVRGITVGALK